jgi:molybdopterin/thiamine biosynthesis adenylyltransferase
MTPFERMSFALEKISSAVSNTAELTTRILFLQYSRIYYQPVEKGVTIGFDASTYISFKEQSPQSSLVFPIKVRNGFRNVFRTIVE